MRGNSQVNGSDLIITDVGENRDGFAFICTTYLRACCNSGASGGTRRGDWVYKGTDGSADVTIGGAGDGGDFYVTRNSQRQVTLSRRNDAMGPLGTYCCEVMTEASPNADVSICANLGKHHLILHYS